MIGGRAHAVVLGSRFEELVREWALRFAAPETLGGPVAEVNSAVLGDPATRTSHEPDLVALGAPPLGDGSRPLLAVGEVKWGRRVGESDLDRLHRIREVVRGRSGYDTGDVRLLLASAEDSPTGWRRRRPGGRTSYWSI
ncbi:hypothetical protein [Plantactinospora sp. WMMB782]|uniref:hypothetical protein n=1 Tax=Plantactinospora sp. WMMB782 TaxID=3404121 RepID=UPI003B92290C